MIKKILDSCLTNVTFGMGIRLLLLLDIILWSSVTMTFLFPLYRTLDSGETPPKKRETSGGGPLVASEVSVGLSRKTHVLCDVDNFGHGFVFYENGAPTKSFKFNPNTPTSSTRPCIII